jgi:predicted ester cyclase
MGEAVRQVTFALVSFVAAWSSAGCGAQIQTAGAPSDTTSVSVEAPAAGASPSTGVVRPESVVDSAVGFFNAHDSARLAALYAPDATTITPGPRGWREQVGRGPIESAAAHLFAALPDVTKMTTALYTRGDTVVQEWTTHGTHSGELMGVKGTGNPVGFRAISIYRVAADGQIASERTYFDPLTVALQIGLFKGGSHRAAGLPPSAAPARMVSASSDRSAEARNEATVRALFAWLDGARRADELATIVAPTAVFSRASNDDETSGLHAIHRSYSALFSIFPDATFSVTDVIAAGPLVVAEVTMRGTQRGPVAGILPTNKAVTLHRVEVFELDGDKITRARSYSSTLELRGQLDSIPSAGGAS